MRDPSSPPLFAMPRAYQIAWAAGFFDGEGAVTCPFNMYLELQATQVDTTPLHLYVALFGGTIKNHRAGDPTRRDAWRWRMAGRPAARALEEMLPFLTVKREVALLGVELASGIQASTPERRHSLAKLPPEERARRLALGARIRELNLRGPRWPYMGALAPL